MKILFTRFPLESTYGGAEVQTMALMRGLSAHGHATAFLGSCDTLLSLCDQEGMIAAELQIGPPPVSKWTALSFAWRKVAMRKKLSAALNEFSRLDAVVMLSLSEKLLMTQALAQRGTKVIWLEHDRIGPWLTKNPWLSLLKNQSAYATIVTVSQLSKQMYEGLGFDQERIVAIPNGVDPAHVMSAEPAPQKSADRLTIGCIARLSREKGVDMLIEALADLPQWYLAIIGTGREEESLRARIAQVTRHEGTERIQIQSQTNVGAFYRSIDLLVLPSREHDPFGMVAAEAMSVGIPVIVTSACGIAGYLRDGIDALIVEPDSTPALSRAISQLSDPDERKRMGAAGKATAHRLFSLPSMISAYETILQH